MKDSFSPVNMLLKGTSQSIEKALKTFDVEYKICEGSTFNPDNIDSLDSSIKIVKVLFLDGLALDYDIIMEPKTIPIAKMQEIKYLILGEGNDNGSFNGLFALFKDFGEIKNSVCYHFSKYWHFHIDFEDDEDLNQHDKAVRSFLDHTWDIDVFDDSTGEYDSIKFAGKKAKQIIDQWENDERFTSICND